MLSVKQQAEKKPAINIHGTRLSIANRSLENVKEQGNKKKHLKVFASPSTFGKELKLFEFQEHFKILSNFSDNLV